MRDRMGRALRAFEAHGDSVLVLGAFGCGSFEKKAEMVATIWAELLVCGEATVDSNGVTERPARFKHSFEKVVFAVPGRTSEPFKRRRREGGGSTCVDMLPDGAGRRFVHLPILTSARRGKPRRSRSGGVTTYWRRHTRLDQEPGLELGLMGLCAGRFCARATFRVRARTGGMGYRHGVEVEGGMSYARWG